MNYSNYKRSNNLFSTFHNRANKFVLSDKDLKFLLIIVILLISSKLFNVIRNEKLKKWSSFCLSIVLILIGSRFSFKELFITLFYNLILSLLIYFLKYNHHLPLICNLTSFILIIYLRCIYANLIIDQTNLALMIMLVRSISLSYDLMKFTEENKIDLTFENIFNYLFCHCGLLTGPFYRYRVYKDWLSFDLKKLEFKNLVKLNNDRYEFILNRLKILVFMIICFLIGNLIFPLNSIKFTNLNFIQIFVQTICIFYIYRIRLYVGFILSEIICVLNYLGIYSNQFEPKPGCGPTIDEKESNSIDDKIKYSFDTIKCFHNLKIIECSGSVQSSLRNWNLTIQFWLFNFVYRKLKWHCNDLVRFYFTLFISALWHGNFWYNTIGYFLSFFFLPIIIIAEKQWCSYIKDVHNNAKLIVLLFWSFKISLIAYFGMAFILLDYNSIINYYRLTYFLGHFVLLIFFIYSIIFGS